MTTKQALAELKRLVKQSRELLYRRIGLADHVLQDLDWIAEVHDGSDLKAQDALENEFFPDLGGYVTLGKLRAMFRHVPKSKWEELKYRVEAVEIVYDEQSEPEKREMGKRTAWKQIAEERSDKLEVAERQRRMAVEQANKEVVAHERTKGRNEQLAAENTRLRQQNVQLQQENAELRIANTELRRQLERQPVGV